MQESKEFRVVIELKNLPDDLKKALRPGMSAQAVITTKTVNSVDRRADSGGDRKETGSRNHADRLRRRRFPTAGAAKPKIIKGVFVMENGVAKFVEVQTGITGDTEIQITSGLSEGQQVITGPSRVLNKLKDGEAIRKQTGKTAES